MANRHTKSAEEIAGLERVVDTLAPDIQKVVATRIAQFAKASDNNFSIDPFTIMAILNCIIAVVKLLYMCYSKDSVKAGMKNPGMIQKLLLKRELRKHFNKEDRKAVYGAMLEVSKSLSENEIVELVDSVGGN